MAIDDNWSEALRKSAEEITPGDKSQTQLRTRVTASALPDGAATAARQDAAKTVLDNIYARQADGAQKSRLLDQNGNPYVYNGDNTSNALPIQIIGNDGLYRAIVDSVGRLAVNANVTFPETIYSLVPFLNGASKAMNVNGSGTAVNFRYTPPVGQTWYIERVSLALANNADLTNTGFFGETALTNGIQFNVKSKGAAAATVFTLRDTYDAFMQMGEGQFNNRVVEGLQAFNYWRGHRSFLNRIVLDGDLGDYAEMKVQDNLTTLTALNAGVTVWKVSG